MSRDLGYARWKMSVDRAVGRGVEKSADDVSLGHVKLMVDTVANENEEVVEVWGGGEGRAESRRVLSTTIGNKTGFVCGSSSGVVDFDLEDVVEAD